MGVRWLVADAWWLVAGDACDTKDLRTEQRLRHRHSARRFPPRSSPHAARQQGPWLLHLARAAGLVIAKEPCANAVCILNDEFRARDPIPLTCLDQHGLAKHERATAIRVPDEDLLNKDSSLRDHRGAHDEE